MVTHHIDLVEAKKGKARMFHNGEDLGVSSEPLFSASRKLLAKGLANPEDYIETYRGQTPCCRSTVGVAAGLTVVEDDRGIRFQNYGLPSLKLAA
ncbi:MAG: hypothetical protein ACR65X_01650 [Methylocystis sp.]|jgi:hypothetical protein